MYFKNKKRIYLVVILLFCITKSFASGTGNLSGFVIEEQSGTALSSANIIIYAQWIDHNQLLYKDLIGTMTDKDGHYLITNLQPGIYSVKVTYMGYADKIHEKIEILPNKTTNINFKLVFQAIKGQQVTVISNKRSRTADYSYIAARIPLSLHDTPMSIDVITNKVLQEQQAVVLSDALQNTVGINVQNNLGTQDYFIIRGFSSNSTGLVLNDGIKQPFTSPFKFFGVGYYDLYNIEQVEVLKGPAAFLYGGNTLSGAINLLKKKPHFSNFNRLKFTHSRFGSYQESFDINKCNKISDFAFRVNGIYKLSKESRKHNENETIAFNPALSWQLKENSKLNVDFDFKYEKLIPDVGIPLYKPDGDWELPDVPLNTNYQENFDKSTYYKYYFKLSYQKEFSENTKIENRFFSTYYTGYSRFTMPLIPYRHLGITWTVPRNLYTINQNQLIIGNQLDFNKPVYIRNIKNNILIGMELIYSKNLTQKRASELGSIDLFNLTIVEDETFDELITFPEITTKTNMGIAALYFIDYLFITENLQFFGGLRADYISYYTNRQNDPFNYIGRYLSSDPIPFNRNYLKASPMLGIIWRNTENLSLYVNSGRAFASGQRIIDEPEVSTQYEMGYHYKSDNNKFRNSVALFSIRQENISIPITGPLQGNQYSSTGVIESNGMEIEFTYQPSNSWYFSFKNSFNLAEYINYNALTSDDNGNIVLKDISGNKPLFVPANISFLSIKKDFKNGLIIGAGLRYVSEQYTDYENEYSIENHFIYQFHTGYSFENWAFKLNINKLSKDNLLARGLGPYSVVPLVPMEIKGSIEAKF